MPAVTYRCGGAETTVSVPDARFLLTDGRGGYLALGGATNYDGWYATAPDGHRWKILYDIAPTSRIEAMELDDNAVTRRAGDTLQELRVSDRGVSMRGEGQFLLTLDCKRQYDESDQGRIYAISATAPAGGGLPNSVARVTTLTVAYAKYLDGRIAPDTATSMLHVGIATTFTLERRESWREVRYPYDHRRGTRSTPWVRDVAFLTGKGELAMALGADARDARRKAIDLLMRPPRDAPLRLPPRVAAATLPVRLAWRSLSALRTPTGILAGLPWFFQEWSRDELVSCGAFIAAGERDAAIRIVDKWYRAVRQDGTLPAIHPDRGWKSADAPGWLGRRTLDLIATGPVPESMLIVWRDAAARLIGGLDVRDGLVWSGRNETWMDTASGDDGRAGARIEVQALALALLGAHAALCERTGAPEPDRALQATILAAVRSRLIEGGLVIDGLAADGTPDRVARPNVFLAWYAWPELAKVEEWCASFWRVIERLWRGWGGLASIDPADPRYRDSDTGEDVAAYHRGDSWYFVNAIAAMALRAVDPDGSGPAARQLIVGIERDMLSQGYLGHVSEISSAGTQEAMGCHAQAWSAACYLEAMLR